jgi:formiminoglutamase
MTDLISYAALFEATDRPDPALRQQRGDPNDLRLGELISHEPRSYMPAQVVLLGCPQDEGVRRNRGRPGAAKAPGQIRSSLARLTVSGLRALRIFDMGDVQIQPTLEETHALLRSIVRRVVSDGKRLVVIGGGNDITYPDCAGLAEVVEPVLALNIDAHFDLRDDVQRNSGTPYRQLLEENIVRASALYELGVQMYANSPVYARYLREHGVTFRTMDDLRVEGVRRVVSGILASRAEPAIFWGFDMDVVRAADAPGVSAPNPTGMSSEDFCTLFSLAGADPRTRLVELSEVNPEYDHDQRTCRLAAVAIWSFLTAVAARETAS